MLAPHGWYEPTNRADEIVRADPAAIAKGLAGRLGSARAAGAAVHWTADWLRAGERAAGAIEAELAGESEPSEPGVHSQLGRLYADGDVVYTASSMPIRDQEAFLAAGPGKVAFSATGAPTGSTGSSPPGAGAAIAAGRPTWIVTGDLGLVHDAAGWPRSPREGPGPGRRDQQRGRRHLRVPAAGRAARAIRVRGALRHRLGDRARAARGGLRPALPAGRSPRQRSATRPRPAPG